MNKQISLELRRTGLRSYRIVVLCAASLLHTIEKMEV